MRGDRRVSYTLWSFGAQACPCRPKARETAWGAPAPLLSCPHMQPHPCTQVLQQPSSQKALVMSEGYFFQLLDRMVADVAAQPVSPKSAQLLQQLKSIQQESGSMRPAAG